MVSNQDASTKFFVQHDVPETGCDSIERYKRMSYKYDTLTEAVESMESLKNPELFIAKSASEVNGMDEKIEKAKKNIKEKRQNEKMQQIYDNISKLEDKIKTLDR